jgi:hypothetical protein
VPIKILLSHDEDLTRTERMRMAVVHQAVMGLNCDRIARLHRLVASRLGH